MSASTPHAPLGANASLSLGPVGSPRGFSLSGEPAPNQDVFIGCRPTSSDSWSLLPFFAPPSGGPQPLPKGRYGRFLASAGDKWMIGPLVFKLCTPFPLSASNDEDRFWYAPVVCGILEYDNSHSAEPAELIFGFGGIATALSAEKLVGFGAGTSHGFATENSSEVQLRQNSALFGSEIGPASALHFSVPPKSRRIYPLVFAFYQPNFFYTQLYPDLSGVLNFGLANHARYLERSDALDAEFMRSELPFAEKTALSHRLREWLLTTRRARDGGPIDFEPARDLWRSVTGNA